MSQIETRREATKARLEELQRKLTDSQALLGDRACVYATGSFGRLEASVHSDLDAFIVGRSPRKANGKYENKSQLSRLDEIVIKADLIDSTRAMDIPDFDADGRYLVHHSIYDLTNTLGTPEDDVSNTFTARLLMLLEGRPLLGQDAFRELANEIIAAYWRDFEDHKTDFVPAFVANDILRLWRTFCVNYEARTEREPAEQKAKGKLKNYKLKHSRLLTCYSALLYMMVLFQRNGTVSPKDMEELIRLSPLERIGWLLGQQDTRQAKGDVEKLIQQYETFLSNTNAPESELIKRFQDKETIRRLVGNTYQFGETMFDLIMKLGNSSRFHRILVV